jgi:hypothetical protein
MVPIISKKDIEKWLKGKSRHTQDSYLRILTRLTLQVEENPDSLIRLVKAQDPQVLRELIEEHPPKSRSVLRGFFKANGCSSASKNDEG